MGQSPANSPAHFGKGRYIITIFNMGERHRAAPLQFRPESCLEDWVNQVETGAALGQGVLEVLTSRINTQADLRSTKVRAGKTTYVSDPQVVERRGVEEHIAR